MSLKAMLGLESFPIGDAEIMRQIKEAYSKKQNLVEFSSGKRKVTIRLSPISPEGLMDGYQEYYAK